MTFELDYDESIDSIIIKPEMDVGLADVLELRDALISHPKFRANIYQLFDASEHAIDLTSDDLKNIAQYYLAESKSLGDTRKLALVVSRDLDYGRMRQYEVFFNSGPGVIVQSFRSLSKAKAWLQVRNDDNSGK